MYMIKSVIFEIYTLPPWVYLLAMSVAWGALVALVTWGACRIGWVRWARDKLDPAVRMELEEKDKQISQYRDDIRFLKEKVRAAMAVKKSALGILQTIPDVVFLDE